MAENRLVIEGYVLSQELFEKGFPEGTGPCHCKAECCEGGVYADVRERDAILAHKEIIKEAMDDSQSRDDGQWFEEREHDDADFRSGRCVGTREIGDKCAFLDAKGRCSIQVACTANGMHKWALKPLFCILYPVSIEDRVIGFDEMLQGEQSCCSIDHRFDVPFFEGCREELVHLLGENGFLQMREYYQRLSSSRSLGQK